MMRAASSIPSVESVALFPSDGRHAVEAAGIAASWLAARGVRMLFPRSCAAAAGAVPRGCELVDDAPRCDLAIALGGDGTLLRTARWVAELEVPVLGVNLGTLGFLSAYGGSDLEDALRAAVDGSLVWEPRLRVRVEIERDGAVVESAIACNDCYVKHGASPRMLQLATNIGGATVAEYRADGLIISTPMGSTAYNLAAGGPIVDAGTQTLVVTPICPHSLTHRPVVTSADSVVEVRLLGPEGAPTLCVDGQWGATLRVGDTVRVTPARTPLRLVPPSATVFEVLRHKLGWSGCSP